MDVAGDQHSNGLTHPREAVRSLPRAGWERSAPGPRHRACRHWVSRPAEQAAGAEAGASTALTEPFWRALSNAGPFPACSCLQRV